MDNRGQSKIRTRRSIGGKVARPSDKSMPFILARRHGVTTHSGHDRAVAQFGLGVDNGVGDVMFNSLGVQYVGK